MYIGREKKHNIITTKKLLTDFIFNYININIVM